MKNKTVAAWLAFLGGPLGLHRFYLHGLGDLPGWLLPIPTALGLYGIERVQQFGLDDHWSWVLIPLAGFTIAPQVLLPAVSVEVPSLTSGRSKVATRLVLSTANPGRTRAHRALRVKTCVGPKLPAAPTSRLTRSPACVRFEVSQQ